MGGEGGEVGREVEAAENSNATVPHSPLFDADCGVLYSASRAAAWSHRTVQIDDG